MSKEELLKLFIVKRNQYIFDKFIKEYADKNITDIVTYLNDIFKQSDIIGTGSDNMKYSSNFSLKKENIVKKIYASLVYTERYNKTIMDVLFKKPKFINTVINKIEEFTHYHEMRWSIQFIQELKKIRAERFPDMVFKDGIYQIPYLKNIRL
jgi:hypothetical protein